MKEKKIPKFKRKDSVLCKLVPSWRLERRIYNVWFY